MAVSSELEPMSFLVLAIALMPLYVGVVLFWEYYRTPEWAYHYERSTALESQTYETEDWETWGRYDEYGGPVKRREKVITKWIDHRTGKTYTIEQQAEFVRQHNFLGALPLLALMALTYLYRKQSAQFLEKALFGSERIGTWLFSALILLDVFSIILLLYSASW